MSISVLWSRAARLGLGLALAAAGLVRAETAPANLVTGVAYLGSGHPERLDLYLPARAANDPPSPTVVWIHGGTWRSGSRTDAQSAEVGQSLAAAGYVCASVDYPLGPDSWPANLLACKNAVRFLRVHAAEYHVDADRIAVMGSSAGGQLALLVALTTGDRALEPTGPYPRTSDAVSASVVLDGLPIPGGWPGASPVRHVRTDSPPVFIAQGLADTRVDPSNARALDAALTSDGVAHQVVFMPGIGHGFDLAGAGGAPLPCDLRGDVVAFLRQYLGIAAHGLPVEPPAPGPRIQLDLDSGWRFFPYDSDRGQNPDLDDSSWQKVNLPHTWNARDGEEGGAYYRGACWYRKHWFVPSSLSGKRLYLQFDGACFQADVYVNGTRLGRHLGGFARFRFDATDALNVGQDNLIAVRVDNSSLGMIPVRADFTFFGGLYRPVSLIAVDPVQISLTDYASSGVYVTQERVTPERADLNIRAEVENYEDKDKPVDVTTDILSASGRRVATGRTRVDLLSGDAYTAVQDISLARPHLWDGEADPYLYTVRVTVRVKGKVRDEVTQPLGIRFFRVDPNRGFFLNGRHLDLHGVNRHQDRVDEGWAISQADEAEDFALVRELGCTAIRLSHYQQSQSWYDRCDRAGLIVWTEIPFVDDALPGSAFLDNAEDQLRELIRQNYNHPSICFWGVGNETKGKLADHVLAELANLAKAEDSTRLTTYASNAAPSDPRNWHTDVVGFNHYAGWYPDAGAIAQLPAFLDSTHAAHPNTGIALSEYGAGASIFEHLLPPLQPRAAGPFHPEEYQSYFHERYWSALSARPFIWGKFVWCMFDFASASRNEGDHPGRNDKGLVTYDRRTRKDAFYFYKANWSRAPVVYLASGRFLVRRRPDTVVTVYSNAPEVELRIDGRSLGVKRSADHVFRWPGVILRPGDNPAAAIGRFGPLTVTDGCTWTYAPRPR